MQVETYEVPEVSNHPEVTEEVTALCERLGLEGQKDVLTGDGKSQIPYRRMTAEEKRIYEVLCGARASVTTYNDGPIPLRVLQVLAHAKSLDYFDEFVVWYPKPGIVVDDPILIGTKQDAKEKWVTNLYLLARWGDTLKPLEELAKQAGALWRNTALAALERCMAEVKAEYDALLAVTPERAVYLRKSDMPHFGGVL